MTKVCLGNEPAAAAARIMREQHVDSVPVVRDRHDPRVIGFVTDRDLAVKVIAESRDPASVRVEEIMSRKMPWRSAPQARTIMLGGFCLGIGAAMMFLFDPSRGRRRRTQLRDQAIHAGRRSGAFLGKMRRDLKNRAQGTLASAEALVRSGSISDAQLEARVRSRLGGAISHPHAVQISAEDGRIILHGLVLQEEADRLIQTVSAVEGVREIENHLTVHATAENIPAPEGGREHWSPAARVLASAAGGSLLLLALAKGRR